MHPLLDFSRGPDQGQEAAYVAIYYASWLIAVDIRELLLADQIEAAVDECLDGLAFSRDLNYGGLHTLSTGTLVQLNVFTSCGAAFEAAPATVIERAVRQLEVIHDAMPRPSAVMKKSIVSLEIDKFGGLMSATLQAQLPLEARIRLPRSAKQTGLWDTLLTRAAWTAFVDAHERMAVAWDLPGPERDRRLFAEFPHFVDIGDLIYKSAMNLRQFNDGYRITLAALEILRASAWVYLYHTKHDSWPASLSQALPSGVTLIDPCTGVPLELGSKGETLQTICPASYEPAPRKLRLLIHAATPSKKGGDSTGGSRPPATP
jgi:hypothetical protein